MFFTQHKGSHEHQNAKVWLKTINDHFTFPMSTCGQSPRHATIYYKIIQWYKQSLHWGYLIFHKTAPFAVRYFAYASIWTYSTVNLKMSLLQAIIWTSVHIKACVQPSWPPHMRRTIPLLCLLKITHLRGTESYQLSPAKAPFLLLHCTVGSSEISSPVASLAAICIILHCVWQGPQQHTHKTLQQHWGGQSNSLPQGDKGSAPTSRYKPSPEPALGLLHTLVKIFIIWATGSYHITIHTSKIYMTPSTNVYLSKLPGPKERYPIRVINNPMGSFLASWEKMAAQSLRSVHLLASTVDMSLFSQLKWCYIQVGLCFCTALFGTPALRQWYHDCKTSNRIYKSEDSRVGLRTPLDKKCQRVNNTHCQDLTLNFDISCNTLPFFLVTYSFELRSMCESFKPCLFPPRTVFVLCFCFAGEGESHFHSYNCKASKTTKICLFSAALMSW